MRIRFLSSLYFCDRRGLPRSAHRLWQVLWRKASQRRTGENTPRFNTFRYQLLKDLTKLKKSQREGFDDFLSLANRDAAKVYDLFQMFKKGYEFQEPSGTGRFFRHWSMLCRQSEIPEVLKTARAILAHLKRIPAYFTHRVTNALMEWNNSRQGAMTKRPYGFKTLRYLGMKIFKILGKFKFDEPRLA